MSSSASFLSDAAALANQLATSAKKVASKTADTLGAAILSFVKSLVPSCETTPIPPNAHATHELEMVDLKLIPDSPSASRRSTSIDVDSPPSTTCLLLFSPSSPPSSLRAVSFVFVPILRGNGLGQDEVLIPQSTADEAKSIGTIELYAPISIGTLAERQVIDTPCEKIFNGASSPVDTFAVSLLETEGTEEQEVISKPASPSSAELTSFKDKLIFWENLASMAKGSAARRRLLPRKVAKLSASSLALSSATPPMPAHGFFATPPGSPVSPLAKEDSAVVVPAGADDWESSADDEDDDDARSAAATMCSDAFLETIYAPCLLSQFSLPDAVSDGDDYLAWRLETESAAYERR